MRLPLSPKGKLQTHICGFLTCTCYAEPEEDFYGKLGILKVYLHHFTHLCSSFLNLETFGFKKPTISEETMELENDSEAKDNQDPDMGNDPEPKDSQDTEMESNPEAKDIHDAELGNVPKSASQGNLKEQINMFLSLINLLIGMEMKEMN